MRFQPKPFMSYVRVAESGCWEWQGWRDSRGYGKATAIGRRGKDWAHRVSYQLHVGPIPDGLTLDHLCRNVSCVRPDHLEPVTLAENIRRAHPARTECKHGHSLADAYIEISRHGNESKKCRTCTILRMQRQRDRKRLADSDRTLESAG